MPASKTNHMFLTVFILTTFGIFLSLGLDAPQCVAHGHVFSKGRLDTRPLASVATASAAKCLAACVQSEECVSFNYCNSTVEGNWNCELLGQTVCNGCNIVKSASCWKHYAVGCVDGVQAKGKMAEYQGCTEAGFCQQQCGAWSLAGRKNRTETIEGTCLHDHTGTSFVTAFMRNFKAAETVFFGVYISSYSDGIVEYNVTAPRFNSSLLITGVLAPFQTAAINLPSELETASLTTVETKAVLIQTSGAVAVYGYNAKLNSVDAFTVMPLEALGTHHRLATWTTSVFLVVATENDTRVQLDLRQSAAFLTFEGTVYQDTLLNLDLEAYTTFQVARAIDNDFSGMRIESTQPIVVLAGSSMLNFDGVGGDLIVDQIAPISTWGKRYVLVNAVYSELKSFFRVISNDESVSVVLHTESGEQYFSIAGNGSTAMFQLNGSCAFMEADKPVGVVMLAENLELKRVDNAFMMVPSVDMWRHPPFVFSTPLYEKVDEKFSDELMLVVPSHGMHAVRLDGLALNVTWVTVPGLPSHVFSSFAISERNHLISSSDGNWPVFAASFRRYNMASYLFSIGQKYQ